MRWRSTGLLVLAALIVAVGLYRVFDSLNPPTGCGANVGPTAVLGIDPTDGEVVWTQRSGHVRETELADGRMLLDAATHETTLDLHSGTVASCVDRPRAEVDVPARASVAAIAHDADAEPLLERFDANEQWELWRGPPGNPRVRVVNTATGNDWEKEIPSQAMFLFADEVVSIHQEGFSSVVTTYESTTGDVRWSVLVPGSSFVAARGGSIITVAGSSELIGLALADGSEVWRTELGNPGRIGDYSEGGWVRDLDYDADSGKLIARVEATRPYRD